MRQAILITVTAVLALTLAGHARKAEARSEENRVTQRVDSRQQEIPSTTRYVFDRTVSAGRIVREGTGEPGVRTIKTTYTYVNGKLVKERTESTVTKKPSDIVVRISPAGYSRASRSGSFAAKRVLTMNASAYMANEGSMNPTSRTATGKTCEFGIVAVDPRVIPLHSLLYIEGYGFGVAEDTGGAIKGNKIDLCMDSRSKMHDWGRRNVKVHVLRTLTAKELDAMGVDEGVTEKVHDASLLALSGNPEASLPSSPVEAQQNTGDPASTPGRDPSEPRPNTGGTPVAPKTDPGAGKVVAVTKDVNVRAKASSESSIVALLMKGDKVVLGEGQGGWYAVTTPSGTRGFVRGDSVGLKGPDADDFPTTTNPTPPVRETPPTGEATGARRTLTVKKDEVIVRSRATTSSTKLTTLATGTKVTSLGTQGEWTKVELKDGTLGYIRSDMFEAGAITEGKNAKKKIQDEEPPKKQSKSSKKSAKSDDEDPPKKRSKSSGEKSSKKSDSSEKSSKKTSKKGEHSSKSSKDSSEKKSSKSRKSSKSKEESSSKKKSTNKKKKS